MKKRKYSDCLKSPGQIDNQKGTPFRKKLICLVLQGVIGLSFAPVVVADLIFEHRFSDAAQSAPSLSPILPALSSGTTTVKAMTGSTTCSNKYWGRFDNNSISFNTNLLSGKKTFTIMGWVRVDATRTGNLISIPNLMTLRKSSVTAYNVVASACFQTADGKNSNCTTNDTSSFSVTSPSDNIARLPTWQHIALTFDLTSATDALVIYINGKFAARQAKFTKTIGTTALNPQQFLDSTGITFGGSGLYGNMDSLRIYDEVLTTASILGKMEETRPCAVIDHFAIEHDGTALTCEAEAIRIVAHDDQHMPVSLDNSYSVTLGSTPMAGTWSLVNGKGSLSGNTYTFNNENNFVVGLTYPFDSSTGQLKITGNISGGAFNTASVSATNGVAANGWSFTNVSNDKQSVFQGTVAQNNTLVLGAATGSGTATITDSNGKKATLSNVTMTLNNLVFDSTGSDTYTKNSAEKITLSSPVSIATSGTYSATGTPSSIVTSNLKINGDLTLTGTSTADFVGTATMTIPNVSFTISSADLAIAAAPVTIVVNNASSTGTGSNKKYTADGDASVSSPVTINLTGKTLTTTTGTVSFSDSQFGLTATLNQTVNNLTVAQSISNTTGTAGNDTAFYKETLPIAFAKYGMKFEGSTNGLSIDNQIAGKLFGANTKLTLYQPNANNTACVPYTNESGSAPFTGANVKMGAVCIDPATCANKKVTVNNVPINTVSYINNGAAPTLTTLGTTGAVGATSNTIPLAIYYPDVGKIRIFSEITMKNPDNAAQNMVIKGYSNPFTVKPASFFVDENTVKNTVTNLSNPKPAATSIANDGKIFARAGESFNIQVTAAGYDPVTQQPPTLANYSTLATPNFGKERITQKVKFDSQLVAPNLPNGDAPDGLAPNEQSADGNIYNPAISGLAQTFTTGKSATTDLFAWGQVGIIKVTPRMNNGSYLDAGDVIGEKTTNNIGRFYPDHYTVVDLPAAYRTVEDWTLKNACGGFTYSRQPLKPGRFKIQAENKDGEVTTNYRNQFVSIPKTSNASMPVNNLVFGASDAATKMPRMKITGGGGEFRYSSMTQPFPFPTKSNYLNSRNPDNATYFATSDQVSTYDYDNTKRDITESTVYIPGYPITNTESSAVYYRYLDYVPNEDFDIKRTDPINTKNYGQALFEIREARWNMPLNTVSEGKSNGRIGNEITLQSIYSADDTTNNMWTRLTQPNSSSRKTNGLLASLEHRYGRLAIYNAFGPQNQNLNMVLRTEYFDGKNDFLINSDDNCTYVEVPKIYMDSTDTGKQGTVIRAGSPNYTYSSHGHLLFYPVTLRNKIPYSAPPTPMTIPMLGYGLTNAQDANTALSACGFNTPLPAVAGLTAEGCGFVKFQNGLGNFMLTAPYQYGYVDVKITAPYWLQYIWEQDNAQPLTDLLSAQYNPFARATFGIFRNQDQLIDLRETFENY